ncbi:MAG: B12-binding domain-containing radical SAM protein [Planctomycetota bacterium]|jgi:hypothetical protein
MVPKILLVNPPIYDFAAYDFWLKPYGMLSRQAEFTLFDYLNRLHPFIVQKPELKSDQWGRGRFCFEKIEHPEPFEHIPRFYRRFGLPRKLFQDFLEGQKPFDFALIQTTMTYWYPGVSETIEDIRKLSPKTKIILGGNYVTLCPGHATTLGADLLVKTNELKPLWDFIQLEPDFRQSALWEAYNKLKVGVLKLAEGCPFKCTYCSVPKVYGTYKSRPIEHSISELELMAELGAENISFYDDALLFDAEHVLLPFLQEIIRRNVKINFHSPNALNARFMTKELADLMIKAGFKTFYLGFESSSEQWQEKTGSKVFSDELSQAVQFLKGAGADPQNITAYQILGHPHIGIQQLEESMRFVNSLGIRGMLADFSPIPGTPDGELCRKWVDMDEPLFHNNTTYPIIMLGFDESNRLKDLQRKLNRSLE